MDLLNKIEKNISNTTPKVKFKVSENGCRAIEIEMNHKYIPRIKNSNNK